MLLSGDSLVFWSSWRRMSEERCRETWHGGQRGVGLETGRVMCVMFLLYLVVDPWVVVCVCGVCGVATGRTCCVGVAGCCFAVTCRTRKIAVC